MEWIKTKDQLPPLGEEVLVWQEGYHFAHLYLSFEGKRWSGDDYYMKFEGVKYWTHLPKPPEETK